MKDAIYYALRHYQKQGLCEGNEYDDIENFFAEYEKLQADSWELNCLEAAGVDNWSGYDDAMQMMEEFGDE